MENLMLDCSKGIPLHEFVLRFLRIHPFGDGNGRTVKLIVYFLSQREYIWENQNEFIEILRNNDYKKMEKYLCKLVRKKDTPSIFI